MKEKPSDLLLQIISNSVTSGSKFRTAKYSKPGEIINSLSQEDRKILESLKSEDLVLEKLPRYIIQCLVPEENMLRKLKEEFDKTHRW